MAKKKKKFSGPRFARIYRDVVYSPEFMALSTSTQLAYVLLKLEISYNGQNRVTFTYTQAQKFMTKRTFTKAIRELEKIGLIKIEQMGGLYRRQDIYRFTDDVPARTPKK